MIWDVILNRQKAAANCNSASLPTCVKKQRRRQSKKASQFRVLR